MQANNQQRNFNVIPASHKPISAWGYVGYQFLFSIPVIGWIIWLFKALGAKNKNVKNYARSYFCNFVLAIIVAVVTVAAIVALYYAAPDIYTQVVEFAEKYSTQA